MARALLINPSYAKTYSSNQGGIANPVYPILGLATIAATAIQRGHQVTILDLSYRLYDPLHIRDVILRERPDVVGITAATLLTNQMRDISCLVKEISQSIVVVGGGAHPSALPAETLRESMLDYVAYGEADETFADIMDGRPPLEIAGICHRGGDGQIVKNPPRPLVEYLDDLPIPAWHLYPVQDYLNRVSRLVVRRPPATTIEFSRGCVFKCDFCASKNTMGFGYRKKSPERCAEEMAYLYRLGYREAILADDIFTSDNKWAVAVCEELIRRGIKMAWTCTNGIRVDSADDTLFTVMKRAGCYRVHFGFESGNDAVLRAFGKGGRASLEQGFRAVAVARRAGLDTFGMYLVGLSSDTAESMQDTIDFARKCQVDMAKIGITIPFPGTPMFTALRQAGRIRTWDWDEYNVYNESQPVFEHPTLTWETIQRYYRKAYREVFLKNPRFILRRFIRGIRTGEFFWDLYYTLKLFVVMRGRGERLQEGYVYRDRWPVVDYRNHTEAVPIVLQAKGSTWRRPSGDGKAGAVPAAARM